MAEILASELESGVRDKTRGAISGCQSSSSETEEKEGTQFNIKIRGSCTKVYSMLWNRT